MGTLATGGAVSEPATYGFGPDLPIAPIEPGQTLLVAGPATSGARELALTMLLSGSDAERRVVISTDLAGSTLLEECDELLPGRSASRLRAVDCSEGTTTRSDERVTTAEPGNLTETGMAVSSMVEEFYRDGVAGTRVGIDSVSGLLHASGFKPVSRFIHTLSGRIEAVDGLGVCFLDTTMRSEEAADAFARLVDGRVDVRERETGQGEIRVRGLPGQPDSWTPFDVELQWPRRVGPHLIDRRVSVGESVSKRFACLRCDFSTTGRLDADELTETRCR